MQNVVCPATCTWTDVLGSLHPRILPSSSPSSLFLASSSQDEGYGRHHRNLTSPSESMTCLLSSIPLADRSSQKLIFYSRVCEGGRYRLSNRIPSCHIRNDYFSVAGSVVDCYPLNCPSISPILSLFPHTISRVSTDYSFHPFSSVFPLRSQLESLNAFFYLFCWSLVHFCYL